MNTNANMKKLVVNLKGAEQIKLKKIMVNGKKRLVPATPEDTNKIELIKKKIQVQVAPAPKKFSRVQLSAMRDKELSRVLQELKPTTPQPLPTINIFSNKDVRSVVFLFKKDEITKDKIKEKKIIEAMERNQRIIDLSKTARLITVQDTINHYNKLMCRFEYGRPFDDMDGVDKRSIKKYRDPFFYSLVENDNIVNKTILATQKNHYKALCSSSVLV
jgi:hypothetical protein